MEQAWIFLYKTWKGTSSSASGARTLPVLPPVLTRPPPRRAGLAHPVQSPSCPQHSPLDRFQSSKRIRLDKKTRENNFSHVSFTLFCFKGARHILTRTLQLQHKKRINGEITDCTKRLKQAEQQVMKLKKDFANRNSQDSSICKSELSAQLNEVIKYR